MVRTQRPNEPKRPQNGKDGEGPPDLDEMWRDFNRRLSSVFGRKGTAGGAGRPDNGRGARIGVGIVIGVLIAIYLGSGVFVVQDGQAGVVTQFGKYRYTATQGVHWRLPYPFEAHELVNIGDDPLGGNRPQQCRASGERQGCLAAHARRATSSMCALPCNTRCAARRIICSAASIPIRA